MSDLLNIIKHWLNRRVAAIEFMEIRVRELTQISLGEVRQSLRLHWRQMNASQARGYARAKARPCVSRNARALFAHEPNLSASAFNVLLERAIEQVAQSLTRELMTQPAEVKIGRAA